MRSFEKHYLHDGWSEATFRFEELGYEGNFYNLKVGFTDATDFERFMMFLTDKFNKVNSITETKRG